VIQPGGEMWVWEGFNMDIMWLFWISMVAGGIFIIVKSEMN
jgi:hypothetical protein